MGRLFTYMVKAAAGNSYGDYNADDYAAWVSEPGGPSIDSPRYVKGMEQEYFKHAKAINPSDKLYPFYLKNVERLSAQLAARREVQTNPTPLQDSTPEQPTAHVQAPGQSTTTVPRPATGRPAVPVQAPDILDTDAAPGQPAPGPEFYQFGLFNKGVHYRADPWNVWRASFRHGFLPGDVMRELRQESNFVKRMYNGSMSSDEKAFFGIDGAKNYATALNSNFTSPKAIYEYLEARPEYRAALQHLADTGSWEKLEHIWATAGDAPGMTDPTWGWRSDYQLSEGAGNAQLILNIAMAEEARRKKDAEEQRRAAAGAQQTDASAVPSRSTTTATVPSTTATGQVDVTPTPQPAPGQSTTTTTPVPTATPAQLSKLVQRGVGAVKGFVQPVIHAVRPDLKVRDTIQKNLAAGKSMYDGITADTPGMTAGQRHALTTRGFSSNPRQQGAAQQPAAPAIKPFDAKDITPEMRAMYAKDPAMRRGLIAMQGANGRVHRAPNNYSFRGSRPSVTATPAKNNRPTAAARRIR